MAGKGKGQQKLDFSNSQRSTHQNDPSKKESYVDASETAPTIRIEHRAPKRISPKTPRGTPTDWSKPTVKWPVAVILKMNWKE